MRYRIEFDLCKTVAKAKLCVVVRYYIFIATDFRELSTALIYASNPTTSVFSKLTSQSDFERAIVLNRLTCPKCLQIQISKD